MRKSDDCIMDQLIEQNAQLNAVVREISELQKEKVDATQKILEGIKKGASYADRLNSDRKSAIEIIGKQQGAVKSGLRIMEKIRHYFNLLIHMEQASLAIHNKKSQDDLARMIDVTNLPLEKFEHEMEQIRLMDNSFQILNVELEKQKSYVRDFGVQSKQIDEDYFRQSEEYEGKLNEGEIVKVSELRNFCIDLHKMIDKRKRSRLETLTESDKAAIAITDEMRNIKIQHGFFFPLTAYKFVNRLVSSTIKSKNLDKLMLFLIFFLFSRLKKFRRQSYQSQLRATILTYNLLEHRSIEEDRKIVIAGGAMLAHLHHLDFSPAELQKEALEDDEPQIVKRYYQTVNNIFSEEFPFMSNLLRLYRKVEDDEPMVPWIIDGTRFIGLVYDFDKELQKSEFDTARFEAGRQAVAEKLFKKYAKLPGADASIQYLAENWQKLIPKSLTM